jgi:hypothetical protein
MVCGPMNAVVLTKNCELLPVVTVLVLLLTCDVLLLICDGPVKLTAPAPARTLWAWVMAACTCGSLNGTLKVWSYRKDPFPILARNSVEKVVKAK